MSQTPDALLDDLWQRLDRGVADRTSAGRVLTLASADAEHGVTVRNVILRGARRATAELELHSDTRAAKIAQIAADPRVCLLFWDARAQVQARMQGRARVLTGAATDDRWARIPEMGRRVYGGAPPPGTPIVTPDAHDPTPSQDAFAMVLVTLHQVDILHLGTPRHLRARFAAAQGWAGQWIAP